MALVPPTDAAPPRPTLLLKARIECSIMRSLNLPAKVYAFTFEMHVMIGLAAALKQQITIEKGRVVESNFHNFPLLTLEEMPEIAVHFVQADPKSEISNWTDDVLESNRIFQIPDLRCRIRPISDFLLFLVLLVPLLSCAQRNDDDGSFPAKNITIIVPFNPGGGFDLQARLLAPFLKKYLPNEVNVVIENVAGAAGKMGAAQLARSGPDGYTIGVVGLESVAFMHATGQLTDDPHQWSWLGQVTSDPLLLAASSISGLKSPADMKTRDFRFGVTSEMLPSAAILCRILGATFRPIHFDGSGDVVLASLRGDLDIWVFSLPTAIKGVRDSQGKMVPLFVVNESRLPSIPEVPTLAELGIEVEAGVYAVGAVSRVIAAPAGLDAKIQEILISAIERAVHDPEFIEQMKRAEFEVVTAHPDAIRTKIKAAVEEFTRAEIIQ